MKLRKNKQPQSGFTLVELMIALVLGLLVAAAASIVFLQSKRSFLENEQVSRIQENGRFAMRTLVRDVSMSGFLGEHLNRATIEIDDDFDPTTEISNECGPAGWYVDLTAMLQLEDGLTGDVPTTFPCITAANYLAGTDAIAVKRVTDDFDLRVVNDTATECDPDTDCCSTGPTPPPGCAIDTNFLYLQTNNIIGLIYHDTISFSSAATEQPGLPREDWRLHHRVYFIRPWSVNVGDNMPSLCRMRLIMQGANLTMTTECLAEGIENMQIEIGLDTDNDRVADTYTPTPTAAQMDLAVAARLFFLVRGVDDLGTIDNTKTYNLGSTSVGPFNDGFYRRVFSTNVQLRNLSNLNALGF